MALMEIDETEVATLRSQVQHLGNYAKVVEALKAHPEAKTLFQAAIKKVKPDAPIPEYDMRALVSQALGEVDKKLGGITKIVEDFTSKQANDRLEADISGRVDSGRAMLKGRGYDKEGIAAVEKLMAEEGIASYDAADALFARRHPPTEMAIPGIQKNWELFQPEADAKEDMKLLMTGGKDRVGDAYVRKMVPEILREIRGQAA